MKTPIVIICVALLFLSSCHREAVAPFTECTEFAQTNPQHPLATDYQQVLDAYVAKGVPGVVAVVYSPADGLWIGAAGKAVIETGTPMESCNVFYSASLAKTYHVVAALALVEEGILDLSRTIDQYLLPAHAKKVPNSSNITIAHLMNHTSGIPDFIEHSDHVTDYFHNLKRTFTQDYFYSKKYPTCRTMQTVLKIVDYQLKDRIKIININIDVRTNQDIVEVYLNKKPPTFILFKDGLIMWNGTGVFTSRGLINIMGNQLNVKEKEE